MRYKLKLSRIKGKRQISSNAPGMGMNFLMKKLFNVYKKRNIKGVK